jgi:hypothetical protein
LPDFGYKLFAYLFVMYFNTDYTVLGITVVLLMPYKRIKGQNLQLGSGRFITHHWTIISMPSLATPCEVFVVVMKGPAADATDAPHP